VDFFSFGSPPYGSHYFVMEHLSGRSLARHLDERSVLGWREALDLFTQLLDGLAAAHARGIVHRDLKPDNVFLADRPDGGFSVKILDFGVAKFTDDSATRQRTQTGVAMGTPNYMSPEHCRGRGVGPWSDIYSLGVMLFEAFTGRMPIDAPSPAEIMSLQLTQEPPPPKPLRRAARAARGADPQVPGEEPRGPRALGGRAARGAAAPPRAAGPRRRAAPSCARCPPPRPTCSRPRRSAAASSRGRSG
jgi:serine/threonine-protein kinase